MQGGTPDITEPNLADGTITTNTIDVDAKSECRWCENRPLPYDGQVRTLDQSDNGESSNLASQKVSCLSLFKVTCAEPNRNLDHTASEDNVKSIAEVVDFR
ncbi:hypothetical protein O9993_17960 [Vibrio lentus]|nr:hypothetical protein [Vibrio lentus]